MQDIKLTLIYTKELLKSNLNLDCCPWIEKYKLWVFLSPLILLVIWVILQMVSSNKRLATEVDIRTKHLESLRKRYKRLFDTIPEYVVVYKHDGEIIDCNGRFVDIFQGGATPPSGGKHLLPDKREREIS